MEALVALAVCLRALRGSLPARPTSSPGWTPTGWPPPTPRRATVKLDRHRATFREAGVPGDVRLRFRARCGGGSVRGSTAAGRSRTASAWYCVLEGTAEAAVAEAQAQALTDLLACYALYPVSGRSCSASMSSPRCRGGCRSGGSTSGPGRSSASRRPGIGAVLGGARRASQDERQRVAATAEGGIWLLRTAPAGAGGGTGRDHAVEWTRPRRFAGAGPGGDDAGLSRSTLSPVLDGSPPGAPPRRGAGLLRCTAAG